ncbi:MAG TPA: carbamoyltransferase C-terminal domain-containing protein, partial [bacterium]|nr:carbamoyltransferase C-terminal domain-containing protein [bacterium]
VTQKCADTAPAITHVDQTARPQLVTEDLNASYYRILKAYKQRTGHSILVNTSFNMHEEPIVRSPEEAIKAYEQSRLHALAIGNYIVEVDWSTRP